MSMQAWEYKVLHRARNVQGGGASGAWDSNVVAQLPELGEEGWELVAVVPRSSVGGSTVAGTTSDELWIFKRPKTVLRAESTVTVATATATPEISATPVEAFGSQRESRD